MVKVITPPVAEDVGLKKGTCPECKRSDVFLRRDRPGGPLVMQKHTHKSGDPMLSCDGEGQEPIHSAGRPR